MKQNNTTLDTYHQDKIAEFKAEVVVNSPGRVNLIGEHTDYNNGFVMPTAIDKSIQFFLKKNDSSHICKVSSLNYDTQLTFDLNNPDLNGEEWSLYIIGIVEELKKLNASLTGFDCLILSNLPMGAGISSSAALECGLAYGLNVLFNLQLDDLTLIKLAQNAEHNYVGTQCGIMDQFASVMSEHGHVIKLDCKSLHYELLPFDIKPYKLLLLNTNVSHNLSSSEYNARRSECEEGVHILKKIDSKINSLRDISLEKLQAHKNLFPPTIYKRCEYVLEENSRVNQAAVALQHNDLSYFGTLMYASHEGLQNKYEVSCKELDWLTTYSKKNKAILGCRMMGGGFGGCVINLIHEDTIEQYVEEISKAYAKEFDINLSAFITVPANGTELLQP